MNKKMIIIASIVLILDQVSKCLIDIFIPRNGAVTIIDNFFYLGNVQNYGAAWGIMQNKTIWLIVFSLVALTLIYRYALTFKSSRRNNLAFGILIGGVIGNLIDRVFLGYVRDFLDFYLFNYDFPVFNISDIAIVCGTMLLILAIIKGDDKPYANKSAK